MLSIKRNAILTYASFFKIHGVLFLFHYLSLEFTRFFISASAASHPYMAMWGATFFMMIVAIIINLLYGDRKIGKDVNTLLFYIPIAHLIYIPFYFYGYQVSIYHNTAVKVINALIVLRLCYFGDRELLSRISITERAKDVFHKKSKLFSNYVNGITIALFFLCAVPLFTLIYIINTDEMRITGIAVVLFTFFIAIEFSDHKIKKAKIANSISSLNEDEQSELKKLRESRSEWVTFSKILGAALVIVILYSIASGRGVESTYFSLGYSDKYNDGKNGSAKISKEHQEKLLQCYKYNPNTIPHMPQDEDCKKIDRTGWK